MTVPRREARNRYRGQKDLPIAEQWHILSYWDYRYYSTTELELGFASGEAAGWAPRPSSNLLMAAPAYAATR
eukprot:7848485-Pyramimonas_sp.AAC.1